MVIPTPRRRSAKLIIISHLSRILVLLLLTLLGGRFAIALEALGVAQQDADLRIGCLYPLTGPAGQHGRDTITSISMALDYLNMQNDGAPKLSVIIEDTKNKQSRARKIARQFIEKEQVDILCGVLNSGIAHEISMLAKKSKTLFIGAGHASSRLINESLHPWYFRVSNDSLQSMQAGARYLKALQPRTQWKTLAYIGSDYDYGHQVWLDLMNTLDSLNVNYSIAAEYYPKLMETDYSHYIDALAKKSPDIVISGLWGNDFVSFVRQAKQSTLFSHSKLAGFEQAGGYYNLARLGTDLPLGSMLAARHHNNWPATARNKSFVKGFQRRSGHYPAHTAQDAYSAIIVIAQAWKVANIKNVAGVRAALPGLKLSLPEDPAGFQSWIDPQTQQIIQAVAIGEVVPNDNYPPAKLMLDNWQVLYPYKQLPQASSP